MIQLVHPAFRQILAPCCKHFKNLLQARSRLHEILVIFELGKDMQGASCIEPCVFVDLTYLSSSCSLLSRFQTGTRKAVHDDQASGSS